MRLFVFDIDGTIIDYNQKILSSTILAINYILKNNDYIAIASGRPFNGVKKYLDLFDGSNKFLICSNGASIYDINKKLIHKESLKIDDLNKVYKYYKNKNVNVFCFIDECVGYYDFDKFVHNEIFLNEAEGIDLKKAKFSKDKELEKIIIAGEADVIDDLIIPSEFLDKYHVVRSGAIFYDVMHKYIDKSYAVSKLKEIFKFEEIFTFGDAMNDYLMIKNFYGIAMGNANNEVKKVAKFITKNVDSDGIYEAIKRIYNKENLNL